MGDGSYSFGGTDIVVSTAERDDDFLIRVSNRGHPLPKGAELKQIWDFGYRGKLAKELHVNGSGIGLYTVKKIVSAHRGWKDAQSRDDTTEFFIHLPKKAALKRDLGILI
jgi:signal transduction histidine kinase